MNTMCQTVLTEALQLLAEKTLGEKQTLGGKLRNALGTGGVFAGLVTLVIALVRPEIGFASALLIGVTPGVFSALCSLARYKVNMNAYGQLAEQLRTGKRTALASSTETAALSKKANVFAACTIALMTFGAGLMLMGVSSPVMLFTGLAVLLAGVGTSLPQEHAVVKKSMIEAVDAIAKSRNTAVIPAVTAEQDNAVNAALLATA
jgi:hypothetical protein